MAQLLGFFGSEEPTVGYKGLEARTQKGQGRSGAQDQSWEFPRLLGMLDVQDTQGAKLGAKGAWGQVAGWWGQATKVKRPDELSGREPRAEL